MSRGMLTEEIENKSNELFGYKFNQRELRLLPYVQYCVLNNMNISPDKVNGGRTSYPTEMDSTRFLEKHVN